MSEHAVHRRPRRESGGVRQVPWRRLVNPYHPVEILSADQVETIHQASLRILAEIGIQVLGDRAMDALAGAGAIVRALIARQGFAAFGRQPPHHARQRSLGGCP